MNSDSEDEKVTLYYYGHIPCKVNTEDVEPLMNSSKACIPVEFNDEDVMFLTIMRELFNSTCNRFSLSQTKFN